MRLKFTKKKCILPCCVESWAGGVEGRLAVLAKAARILPGTMGDKVANGKCFTDIEATKIHEATLGLIEAKELPDGVTYQDINMELERRFVDKSNMRFFRKTEFCQCKKFHK